MSVHFPIVLTHILDGYTLVYQGPYNGVPNFVLADAFGTKPGCTDGVVLAPPSGPLAAGRPTEMICGYSDDTDLQFQACLRFSVHRDGVDTGYVAGVTLVYKGQSPQLGGLIGVCQHKDGTLTNMQLQPTQQSFELTWGATQPPG